MARRHLVASRFHEKEEGPKSRDLVRRLTAKGVVAGSGHLVLGTLAKSAEKNVDFVDAFLALGAKEKGIEVASFDRDFDRLDVSRVEP